MPQKLKIRATHILILFAITLLVFARTTMHGFLYWDDQDLVVNNSLLQALSWHDLARIWSGGVLGLYTPLAYTIWAMLAAISRGGLGYLDPRLFHGLNLVVHCVNAVLVYAILVRVTKNSAASLVAAAIWAIHPLQVEAVAWISGFNNLLAGMFGLAAILGFLCAMESPRMAIRGLWYAISTFLFVLALFSKPTAVVVPVIALVLMQLVKRGTSGTEVPPPLGRPTQRGRGGGFVLMGWVFVAIAFMVIAAHVQPATNVYSPSPFGKIFVAADAVGFYLTKIFVPWHLHVDYGRSPQWVLKHPGFYPLIFAIALGIASVSRAVRIGLLIFILALLPVLGLRPFDFQKYSTVADRYVYLAMLAVALVVAVWLSKVRAAGTELATDLTQKPTALPGAPRQSRGLSSSAAWIIVIILMALAYRQVGFWRDERILFDYDIALNPRSAAAHKVLGFVDAHDGRITQAADHYAAALAIMGPDAALEYDWGNLLLNKANDPLSAIEHYRMSLRIKEDDARVHNNLGIALFKIGDRADAKREFERALEIDVNNADAKKNLKLVGE